MAFARVWADANDGQPRVPRRGRQLQEEEDVVNQVIARVESGELTNFVEGTYESYGKIDVPAYSRRYSEAGFKRFESIPLAGPTSAAIAYK